MTVLLTAVIAACVIAIAVLLVWNQTLATRAVIADQTARRTKANCEAEVARAQSDAESAVSQARAFYDSEVSRIFGDAQKSLGEAQQLVQVESDNVKQESIRVRQHYLDEARKVQAAADATVSRVRAELEPLRKYQHLKDAETEAQRQLAEALGNAAELRKEAKTLLQRSTEFAASARAEAKQRSKVINEQADARLDQAILDAGRIVADAEKRAQEIGGDAYSALKEKRMLEQAAEAMRNIIDGYGDRYLVPTHSLLDDLALEYGYELAGQSLAAAREQTRKMIEHGQAADCDYADQNRRAIAIQFIVHAFNGAVDSILTRTKPDNFGVLDQKVRDAYAIVNRDGSAFRNARILPEYLNARLAELRWAVVTQELAARDREEQRYLREQERDRQKAEQERQRLLREAEKENEMKRAALAEAERMLAQSHSDERANLEQEVARLKEEVVEATRRELTIAQQTSKGRIYIISNVGSFGTDVYKIGHTRRQAQERVDELSSASVPFEFDIHAVIETDNAPALEYKIHQHFLHARINKVNLRKEFFRVKLDEIRQRIETLELGKDILGNVSWTEMGRAQQYYDSLDIEKNPEARDRWIRRTELIAERRRRELAKSPVVDEDVEDAVGDRVSAAFELLPSGDNQSIQVMERNI